MKSFILVGRLHFAAMNPEERLAIIRARLRRVSAPIAKPPGLNRAALGLPPSKPFKPGIRNEESSGPLPYSVAGEYCPTSDNRPPWVYRHDKPMPIRCAVKRTAKPHHLTMIAEKWKGLKRAVAHNEARG